MTGVAKLMSPQASRSATATLARPSPQATQSGVMPLWGDGIGGCEERRMDDSVSRVSPDEVAQVNGDFFGGYSLFRKFKKSCAGAGGQWAKKGLGGRAAYQRRAGAAPSPC